MKTLMMSLNRLLWRVNGGVQFDYQHYEIGPGYFGQVSITIPYEKIKPYMTEEAKNALNI